MTYMIRQRKIIPIAQTGRVLRILSPDEKASQAQKENSADIDRSKYYFDQAPSIPNLTRGVFYWLRGSEWSPFSRAEDPESYKYIKGEAPVVGSVSKDVARRAVRMATNIAKKRYFDVGKRYAERAANIAKKSSKTTKEVVDATKKGAVSKIDNFWGNRMNLWETSKNSTASKGTRALFNAGRVVLGTNIVAPTLARDVFPGLVNNFTKNWGIDYKLPTRSGQAPDSTKAEIKQDTIKAGQKTTSQPLKEISILTDNPFE